MRRRVITWILHKLGINNYYIPRIQYFPEHKVYRIEGIDFHENVFPIMKDAALKGKAFQFRIDATNNSIILKEMLLVGDDYLLRVPELN